MYAVLDIETGGFSKKKNAICEIGVLIIDKDLNIVKEFQTLIAPYIRDKEVAEEEGQLCSYKEDAMNCHGIPMEDILSAPSAEWVCESLVAILAENNVEYLVGHNLKAFDKPFIEDLLQRFGFELIPEKVIDTMIISRELGNKKNSLRDLCSGYGIKRVEAHRALGDCYDTFELWKILLGLI